MRHLRLVVGIAGAATAAPVSVTTIALSGQPAPGDVDDNPFHSLSAPTFEPPLLNEAGEVLFRARVQQIASPGPDQTGVWIGDGSAPLAVVLYQRRPAPGLGSTAVVPELPPRLPDAGGPVLLGGIPVPPPDDAIPVLFGPVGLGGLMPLLQGGDPAPGIPDEDIALMSIDVGTSGRIAVVGSLFDAPPLDDVAIFGAPAGSGLFELWLREDDAVPSVPGTTLGERFTVLGVPFSSDQLRLNETGAMALLDAWIGFDASSDAKSLWIRDVSGDLELVVRAGQTAPDTGGATFLSPDNFLSAEFNDLRELLFSGVLASGSGVIAGGNDRGLWLYDGVDSRSRWASTAGRAASSA